jgi:hypothetical protein
LENPKKVIVFGKAVESRLGEIVPAQYRKLFPAFTMPSKSPRWVRQQASRLLVGDNAKAEWLE